MKVYKLYHIRGVLAMKWQEIDNQIMGISDIEHTLQLTAIEDMVFDLKYIKLMNTCEIAEEIGYSRTKVKGVVNSIRDKFKEYVNAKEV